MRALVVDDSKAMRTIIGRILKEVGFEVAEACHGRDALAVLDRIGAVELALVDWNMPEMDGLAFVQAVRAQASYRDMLLMMVSTEAELSRVTDALSAGANEYLMKPFTSDAVRDKLTVLGLVL